MRRADRFLLDGIFLLVLLAFSAAFFRLMEPFFLSVFLALVLANIFKGRYTTLCERTGRPPLAAALTTALIVLVVLIPVVVVTTLVTAEIVGVAEKIRGNWEGFAPTEILEHVLDQLKALPVIGAVIQNLPDLDVSGIVGEALSTSSDYLLRVSQRSLGNITSAVFNFFVMLILVFFFFLDGTRIVSKLKHLIPMSNHDIDQISAELFNTTSATLISTIILGLIEGALATTLFLVFGLPSPFLWGVITMILSMIPLVGTNLVLVPAGLITVITGRPAAGILIIVIGLVGVTVTQNILRPKLVGDRTGLHPALALLATIGGIAWLGLIGFLIGPVIASLFIVTWRQFGRRYEELLADKDGGTP